MPKNRIKPADIFISYRRSGGEHVSWRIFDALKSRNYDVFLDFDALKSGQFDEQLYFAIDECKDFLLILPPGALDRCTDPKDWVRLEVERAKEKDKNIIPIKLDGFQYPEELPESLEFLRRQQTLKMYSQLFDAFIDEILVPLLESRPSLGGKRKKVILGVVLAALLCFAAVMILTRQGIGPFARPAVTPAPVSAPTADIGQNDTGSEPSGWAYRMTADGTAEIAAYTGNAAVLQIPSELDGYRVTAVGREVFRNNSVLTSVTIPAGVTSIGDYAFSECSSLSSVVIPDTVTSIGRDAFQKCRGLTEMTLPDSVNSIGIGAFYMCTNLKEITLPDALTSVADYTFQNCSSLTSVTFPPALTSIGYGAFYQCGSLAAITLPDTLTAIGDHAFRECSGLRSVVIPSGVASIGNSVFAGCIGLTSVTLPETLTFIDEYAFDSCSGLISLSVPESVAAINTGAFPDTVTLLVRSGSFAESWCRENHPNYAVTASSN